MSTRRTLLGSLAAGAAASAWNWPGAAAGFPGRLFGANAALGHRLRTGGFPEPTSVSTVGALVVGGGVAGLSALWRLRQQGCDNAGLVELEAEVGGNASCGRNAVSAYPWGAHYVPLLTRESVHAAELFEALGIIVGRRGDGTLIYNDYYLCADPRERLLDQGRWQEDLVPAIGVTEADRRQYEGFFGAMAGFRTARGSDGRKAFAIPLDASSADARFRDLDAISIADWMQERGWDSEPLRWYVEYCMRDDYGTCPAEVSAWAGIHYFAARDGKSAGDESAAVLTWPEGNGWIVAEMKKQLHRHIDCAALAWRVQPNAEGVAVDVFDPARDTSRRIQARAAILAVPHFVTDRLLDRPGDAAHSYAPWMVANVTVDRMPAGRGTPLCWDNVFRHSRSLGYVVATHQALERVPRQTVLTHYWPLSDQLPEAARRDAFGRGLADWQTMVAEDLLRVHPELEGQIRSIDVWVWGHGMIRPTPGYIWGAARAAACVQTPPVFFAHSDMSGISIFEEANHRGVLAADAALALLRA
ncbi:MAG: NAD(P)-binding protein [Janthinobacterium lividum]